MFLFFLFVFFFCISIIINICTGFTKLVKLAPDPIPVTINVSEVYTIDEIVTLYLLSRNFSNDSTEPLAFPEIDEFYCISFLEVSLS